MLTTLQPQIGLKQQQILDICGKCRKNFQNHNKIQHEIHIWKKISVIHAFLKSWNVFSRLKFFLVRMHSHMITELIWGFRIWLAKKGVYEIKRRRHIINFKILYGFKSNQIKCVYFPPKLSSQWDTNQIQIFSNEKCTIAQSRAAVQAGGGTAHKPFSPQWLALTLWSCDIGWLVLGRPMEMSKSFWVLMFPQHIRKIYVHMT